MLSAKQNIGTGVASILRYAMNSKCKGHPLCLIKILVGNLATHLIQTQTHSHTIHTNGGAHIMYKNYVKFLTWKAGDLRALDGFLATRLLLT